MWLFTSYSMNLTYEPCLGHHTCRLPKHWLHALALQDAHLTSLGALSTQCIIFALHALLCISSTPIKNDPDAV